MLLLLRLDQIDIDIYECIRFLFQVCITIRLLLYMSIYKFTNNVNCFGLL